MEKEFLQSIYKALCDLDIKGDKNIQIMFGLLMALQQKIIEIDRKEKETKEG